MNRDVVIFGSGEVGKSAAQLLEKDFHILFLTDNDEKKWGMELENYRIKSPEEIEKYDCDIVITSARYGIEIAGQLKEMGVDEEQLWFFRSFRTEGMDGYDLYPLSEEKIEGTGLQLIQYDLFQRPELETDHKKVLVFCTFFSTYAKQLIENMSKGYQDVEFSLLTSTEEYREKVVSDKLRHIYYFQRMADLKTILEQLPVYDAIQLLWIEREWAYFYKLIRHKTKRLNLNVGGSDFYRTGKKEKDYKKGLIACADTITAETETTVWEFQEYYSEIITKKVGLLPFGIEVLEQIDSIRDFSKDQIRKKFRIPQNKIVVTCGHNANAEHQHKEIIKAICRLSEEIRRQIVCVFPMTYPWGRDDYISEVERGLKESGVEYVILTEFMDFQQMAEYALISDIMIHVQRTDQLSSTMLEEMYAGSIVIAGKWLPYQSLRRMGMFFRDIEKVFNLDTVLADTIENIETYRKKCEGNRELVQKHSSWSELAPRWRALWD